jgi:L-serine/L-threonine ammonia-lyase
MGLLEFEERKTIVVAVETEGAASYNAAVRAGGLVTLDGITSIAKSLGARTVTEATLRLGEKYGKHLVRSLVISDKDALFGVTEFADRYRYLVEPACGASIAPVVFSGLLKSVVPELNKDSKVVVEVCGGFGVNLAMIEQWKTMV